VTVKIKVWLLVILGCGLAIVTVLQYTFEPSTPLSTGVLIGNLSTAAFLVYLAKKFHDESKRDKPQ
jgi:hypothetical protein